MGKKIYFISILCLAIVASPVWGLDFKPGKYEITVEVKMQGMPGGIPPQTMTQCLTEADPVPAGSADAQACKIKNMKTKGNTITYEMACKQQEMEVKSIGEMTYKGETFEGSSKMTMGPSAGGMTVTTMVKGKRIGKCD